MREGTILCDRFRIDQSLGRGGMSDVYLAFDQRRRAHVAVKVLREDLAEDPDFVRRFAREADALARLDHPNIVRFYSFEQEGALAFIVMDYVPGSTLARRLRETRWPITSGRGHSRPADKSDRHFSTPIARATSTAISNLATSCCARMARCCSPTSASRARPRARP